MLLLAATCYYLLLEYLLLLATSCHYLPLLADRTFSRASEEKLLASCYLLLLATRVLATTCYCYYLLPCYFSQASEEKLAAALEVNHTLARLTVDLRGTRAYPTLHPSPHVTLPLT